MSDLKTAFDQAARDAQNLSRRPDNQTMLQLYGLYKQAISGDVRGKRPGFTDMIGRAKYDAWANVKGLDQNGAMQAYVNLVKKLQGR